MKRLLLIFAFCPSLFAQNTYTAATSNYSDVNAVINGPTHTAVNGDIIQIPCSPASVTWSSSLIVNANITLTALGATPNSGASTFGTGTNCLTITLASQYGIQINPTYSATNNLNISTLQNMTLDPGTGAVSAIYVQGTGAAGGMPLINLNNLQFGDGTTQWKIGTTGEFPLLVNNVFGVVHHTTLVNGSQVAFISVNLTSYLGVGLYGDNSWAQPDTYGSANELYIENNILYQGGWPVVENEFPFPNIGGGRAVTRFNHIFPSNGATGGLFFVTGGHGLDTDGRARSMRTNETYGNTVAYPPGTNGYDFCSYRGGTGLCWGNVVTLGLGATLDDFAAVSTYRTIGDTDVGTGFGGCGDAASGQAQGPFDGNDGTNYFPGGSSNGVAGASSSGLTLVDSGSPGWTTNQWSNPANNYPYYVWNITKGWVTTITSNTSNSLTAAGCDHGIIDGTTGCSVFNFSSGDNYQIRRAKWCTDGAARGQGALIQGYPAVLNSTGLPGPSNEALDPIYEWDNTAPHLNAGANVTGGGPQGNATYVQPNREYYTDNSLGSPVAQTSPTSPFNGATGVGFGTLANRPTTCTTGVFYFATDQGSWNTTGGTSGLGYHCTATNTWTQDYTPNTYPYSLAGGGGGSNFTFTLTQTGTGFGSVSGTPSATYPSGTNISVTVAPWVGTSFAWSGVGGCSSAPTCSFTLTGNTTLTLTLTAGTGPVLDAQATNGTAPGSTISIPTTTGHVVYLGFYDGNASGDTLAATDTQGNIWTFATTGNMPTSGNTVGIGCAVASATGTMTITAKANGATGAWHLTAADVANSSCTPDVVATPAYYTAATTCTGNGMTTTAANDFLMAECGFSQGNNNPVQPGTNWLNSLNAGFVNAGSSFYNEFTEAQLAASTGSYTPTSGTTTSNEILVLGVAFLSNPTCGNPRQLGPNYSGSYPASSTPLAIGFTNPTPACSMVMTLDGSTPNAGCTISGSTQAYANQNISATTTMRVRACHPGYADSAVAGGTWTITGTVNYTFSVSSTGTGSGSFSGTNCANGTYASGTNISCTMTPSTGSAYSSAAGTGSAPASSTANPVTFSLASNSTLTVTWNQLPTATPTVTPAPGTYPSPQIATISDATAGSSITYGTATVPGTCSPSTSYTGPVTLSLIPIEYLCAYATATGYAQSPIVTWQYNLVQPAKMVPQLFIPGPWIN